MCRTAVEMIVFIPCKSEDNCYVLWLVSYLKRKRPNTYCCFKQPCVTRKNSQAVSECYYIVLSQALILHIYHFPVYILKVHDLSWTETIMLWYIPVVAGAYQLVNLEIIKQCIHKWWFLFYLVKKLYIYVLTILCCAICMLKKYIHIYIQFID